MTRNPYSRPGTSLKEVIGIVIRTRQGAFNDATYESLVHLTAWFCEKYDLTTSDVIRHYDVTGKNCPLYYVEHPDARQQFLDDVETYSLTNGEGT